MYTENQDQKSYAELKNNIHLLAEMRDEFIKIMPQVKFNNHNVQHLSMIMRYGAILEYCSSIIVLLENYHISSIPVILRSALEAYVDLHNLYRDENYFLVLRYDFDKPLVDILNKAKSGNPNLSKIASEQSINELIENSKKSMGSLKEQGIVKRMNLEEKFRKAGMIDQYHSIYDRLCCDGHNNDRALCERFMCFDSEKKPSIVFFKRRSNEDILFFLEICTLIFLSATSIIHRYFSTECQSNIDRIYQESKNFYPDIPDLFYGS